MSFRWVTTTLFSLRTTACDALIVPSEIYESLVISRVFNHICLFVCQLVRPILSLGTIKASHVVVLNVDRVVLPQRKLIKNRICNVWQQLYNTNVIDCEYHAFFKCVKYDTVRQMYLLKLVYTWYRSSGFLCSLFSQTPGIIKSI